MWQTNPRHAPCGLLRFTCKSLELLQLCFTSKMTQVSYCFLPLVRPPENDRTSNQRQLLVDHLKQLFVSWAEKGSCVWLYFHCTQGNLSVISQVKDMPKNPRNVKFRLTFIISWYLWICLALISFFAGRNKRLRDSAHFGFMWQSLKLLHS